MRATIHNGRTGKDGAYNTKHNDRQFDIKNAEHIDPERVKITDIGTGQATRKQHLKPQKPPFMKNT